MKNIPVVIVTGASRGMGAAVGRWLGQAGAAVALIARTDEGLGRVAADIAGVGGSALAIRADVADRQACRHAVATTLDRFGRLDALINNAGILSPLAFISEADPAAWRYNIEVNLLGPFHMTQASIGELRKRQGRIVNVSSGAAVHPIAAWSAYCVAKAGVTHFTRVLAEEESSLTVVSLRPGVVDTQMQALIREEGPGAMAPEKVSYFKSLKTEDKLEPPWVPARVTAWLALHAPHELSGEFLDYDDPRISEPARTVLGERSTADKLIS